MVHMTIATLQRNAQILTKTFKTFWCFKSAVHGTRIFTATYCIGGVASPKPLFLQLNQ